MEIDDYDDEEESMYNCLYCWEDCGDEESLDYHMREAHPAEADFESCPFCPVRAGNDIVDHLILNHSDSLSVEQVLKLKEVEKKFSYGSSRTHRGDSVLESASTNGVVVDELLSFISEMPPTVAIHNEQQLSTSSVLGIDAEELSGHKKAERAVASSPVSEEKRAAEDKEARSRCDFAQGLMLSVLFDEDAAL